MSSINRPAHILKRGKSLTIPRHFIFFDTETTQVKKDNGDIKQYFKLGWAVYYRRSYGRHNQVIEWLYLDKIETFWDFVFSRTEPKQRLWIIARNIVFDFTVCKGWQFLKQEGYKLKFFHNNGCSCIVTVNKGNRSIAFLDSMNWFTESLASTGDRIGIQKLKIDFNNCTIDELSNYCKNDTNIEFENFRIFIHFLEDNNISRLCYTKASTAMAAYLFRHYHTPIYIHNNAEAIKLERESYKGGRCECFYIGNLEGITYYILDVNSLYPYVMKNNLYPVKYRKILHSPSINRVEKISPNYSIVASVIINTDEPVYALKQDRTIFPVGNFETVLTTPEIKYALAHNHIKTCGDCVIYEQADIFTSYVNTLYNLRNNFKTDNNKEYEQLCKYLLNSLYGKFGQKAENWEKIGDCPDKQDKEEIIFYTDSNKVMRLRYLLGQIFELKSYGEAFNSFPAISSHVTAYARLYLWSLMQKAGEGNYFYCDTDSLIVNEEGLLNLNSYLSETELGKLKLQEKGNHLIIRGLKDYITDTKLVIKGISKNAVMLEEGIYKQQSWPSFKGLLKSEDINVYTVSSITKHLSREYTKGTITNTGKVNPFILQVSY
jgi:hypothetical protein